MTKTHPRLKAVIMIATLTAIVSSAFGTLARDLRKRPDEIMHPRPITNCCINGTCCPKGF